MTVQLKKTLLFTTLTLVCVFAKAQSDSTSSNTWTYTAPTTIFGIYDPLQVPLQDNRFAITAYGDLYLASNCFSASFLQNFFGSGFITTDMKDFAASKLKPENTIGVDVAAGVWLQMAMKKNPSLIFLAGIDYHLEESSRFTPDLFHLAFYGNYDYQNYTADLSGSGFSLTNVMAYKVGLMKRFNAGYNDFTFGATVGLAEGLSGFDMNMSTGSLFTAFDGRYIDLDYDIRVLSSGGGAPKLGSFAGAGISADVFWKGYFKGPEITIQAMANDLGAIWWNNDPVKFSGDTAIRFEGIEIDNIFSASDEAIGGDADSLFSIIGLTEETQETFSQALPSRINISATKLFSNDIYLTLGAQYMLNTPYKPLVFMQVAKAFTPQQFAVAVNAHAGGYGTFNAGVELSKSIGNMIHLRAGTNSLLGLVLPDTFTGLGAYGALHVTF